MTAVAAPVSSALVSGMRVDAAQRHVRHVLSRAEISTPDLDARLLLELATGMTREALIASPERIMAAGDVQTLGRLLERRLAGESVARLRGFKEFWGRDFALAPQTLEPRPDSETLIELALRLLASGDVKGDAPIADLGTGSGCLLITLLAERPDLRGVATDLSHCALETARRNAHIHGVAERALFVQAEFAAALGRGYGLIVANPPYIASDDIADLACEVRDHEPRLALDGGSDGLDAVRAIAPRVAEALVPGGMILLEIGQNQHNDVARLLAAQGFDVNPSMSFFRDHAGIIRVVRGIWRGAGTRKKNLDRGQ